MNKLGLKMVYPNGQTESLDEFRTRRGVLVVKTGSRGNVMMAIKIVERNGNQSKYGNIFDVSKPK